VFLPCLAQAGFDHCDQEAIQYKHLVETPTQVLYHCANIAFKALYKKPRNGVNISRGKPQSIGEKVIMKQLNTSGIKYGDKNLTTPAS